jgi:hypothetical protein
VDIEIRFCDGTFETVYNVVEEKVGNNVLELFTGDVSGVTEKDGSQMVLNRRCIGSFPLINIQRWRVL